MSHEVTQWLGEIKALKQQIADLQSDRDAAWESSEKWRQLYNTEAQQRRTEAKLSQQAIASLKAEIKQIRGMPEVPITDTLSEAGVQEEVEQLQSLEQLKEKLIAVIQERDRLLQALKTEQTNHAQTRKSLTTALGDAIDRLTRERGTEASKGNGEIGT
jgi:chromosome segregation ATPase